MESIGGKAEPGSSFQYWYLFILDMTSSHERKIENRLLSAFHSVDWIFGNWCSGEAGQANENPWPIGRRLIRVPP